ncbi:MAG TPA: hypothetical protein VMS17_20295 [Gemmataceae bacterium]|nr:hypothetical protein [Gemmataceae bacterium]
MSAPTPPPPPPTTHAPTPRKLPDEITIYSHSNLYYWWPVWLCGFIVALVTWIQGDMMAIVPGNAEAFPDGIAKNGSTDYTDDLEAASITHTKLGSDGKPLVPSPVESYGKGDVHVLVSPQKDKTKFVMPTTPEGKPEQPHMYVLSNRLGGVVFVFILLMVILITNVPMRGMWSLLAIVVAVALIVIFILVGWIESILTWLSILDVRINMAGYMTISVFLFAIWLAALLLFDRQRYITFAPGQIRVCEHIGGGQDVYNTMGAGVQFQKQRSDIFRHYILGLGSGDLIVRTATAGHPIEMPNVLFIGAKVRQIERIIKVVETERA